MEKNNLNCEFKNVSKTKNDAKIQQYRYVSAVCVLFNQKSLTLSKTNLFFLFLLLYIDNDDYENFYCWHLINSCFFFTNLIILVFQHFHPSSKKINGGQRSKYNTLRTTNDDDDDHSYHTNSDPYDRNE